MKGPHLFRRAGPGSGGRVLEDLATPLWETPVRVGATNLQSICCCHRTPGLQDDVKEQASDCKDSPRLICPTSFRDTVSDLRCVSLSIDFIPAPLHLKCCKKQKSWCVLKC